ncbi:MULTISPECIES: alpha/beta hydrolase family protein [Bacteria]|uniref:alpha/beta hydrolase family protein n=1 Tax=Bacteria TaxID=2 RepID=UPI003C7D8C25
MPYLDLAVIAGLLATLLVGFLTRRRSPLIVSAVGTAALVALGVAFVAEGSRWQLVAIAVSALLVAGAVLWARSGGSRGLARASGVALAVVLVVLGGAAWGLPPVHVPAPGGPYAVGVASTVWVDDARDARGGDGGEGRRSIPATIWYPASSTGDRTEYLPDRGRADELATALAAQYGMPPLLLDGLLRARANASWDAPAEEGSFPVVIASPGTSSTRWLMTSWAEEIASRGTVVVAVDHPYDAVAAELHDGGTVRGDLTTTGDDMLDQALADGWARVRAADILAVVDELTQAGDRLPALHAADPSRIVAAGHSLGGAAAVEAARLDPRIRGVVDIDGMPRSPAGTVLGRPAVFVVAGDADPNPVYDAAVLGYLRDGAAARLTVDGVTHLSLVDTGLLLAPVPGITGLRGPEGPRLAARATEIVLDAVTTGTDPDSTALAALGRVG